MRRRLSTGAVVALVVGVAMPVSAADMRAPVQPAVTPANWSGFYLGGHLGGGFGVAHVANPYGPSIYGDTVRVPKAFAGVQAGYNWQIPGAGWLFGIEADISAVDGDGTDTCLAYSGQFVSANCRIRDRALGTITGRLGHVFGPYGRSLAYIKGGAAFLLNDASITTNAWDYSSQSPARANGVSWGWTIGAGFEHALSAAWSIKADYSYARFAARGIQAPGGGILDVPFDRTTLIDTVGLPTEVRQDAHLVKVGLNYHFNRGIGAPGTPSSALPIKMPAPSADWRIEVGSRYWYSTGRYQNDLGMSTAAAFQDHLVSRLTYSSTTHSGEVFWRIDSPHRLFLKGFAGLGRHSSGHMNDEDWFPTDPDFAMAYSNTTHGNVTGTIGYATLDLGADLFESPLGKIGLFAGYNFYRDRKDSFGCTQIALPDLQSVCGTPFAPDRLAITQNEDWHSLRLGVNASLTIMPGLKATIDAAYLPYVHVSALDIHHNRTDVGSPYSPAWGTGRGMQMEAILTYDISPQFSIGIGGRYWAMWATDVITASFGSAVPTQTLPIRSERYGTFLQASYKFDAR